MRALHVADATRLRGLHAEAQPRFDAPRAAERFAQRCAAVARRDWERDGGVHLRSDDDDDARALGVADAAAPRALTRTAIADATFNPMAMTATALNVAPDLEVAMRGGGSARGALLVDSAWAIAAGATLAHASSSSEKTALAPPAMWRLPVSPVPLAQNVRDHLRRDATAAGGGMLDRSAIADARDAGALVLREFFFDDAAAGDLSLIHISEPTRPY